MVNLNLEPETKLSSYRKNTFASIVLCLIILVTYSNTFKASWHFDDEINILENRPIHLSTLTWENIKKTFFAKPKATGKLYRPTSCFTLALNYYFGRDSVFGYHLVNIIIHCISAIFLFLFIHHVLNLKILESKYKNRSFSIALLATLFWASNPIQTQAVTYIIQRMASLAGMFYIISMYFYLKGRTENKSGPKIIFYVLCVISGLMAMGSKENAFMLPISIYLFDLFLIQGVSKESLKKNLKIASGIVLITICMGIIYLTIAKHEFSFFAGYQYRAFTLTERLLSQPAIIILYLSLIFYPDPTRLSIAHDVIVPKSLFNPPTALFSLLFIILALLASLFLAKRRPFIAFSIIFFFLNHLMESSIFPLELVFEHRNYLPSMFLFVPVAILLMKGIDYYSNKKLIQVLIITLTISLIVGQGHGTFVRNAIWKTEESLWMHATEKAPDLWRPWHNLGRFYAKNNRHKEALSNYFSALSKECKANPKDKHLTFYDIGLEYQTMGEKDKALSNYLEAERIYPLTAEVHNNKGVILGERGQVEEAIHAFKLAIQYKKNMSHAYSNLGLQFLKMGRIEEAIPNLEKALRLAPEDFSTLLRLGYAYEKKGLYGKAFTLFKRAQTRNPHDPKPLLYLAELYSIRGMDRRADGAMEQFIQTAKDSDIRALLEERAREEEKPDRIQFEKEVLLKLLDRVYSRRASLLSSIREYMDKNATDAPN